MADPPREPEIAADSGGMPRWVKVSLLVVAGLVLLFVILNLAGVAPSDHGPRRHMPGGGGPATTVPEDSGDHRPMEHDTQQP